MRTVGRDPGDAAQKQDQAREKRHGKEPAAFDASLADVRVKGHGGDAIVSVAGVRIVVGDVRPGEIDKDADLIL